MLLVFSSEIGEKILHSEQAKGVINPSVELLKNWMVLENKKLLKELKKDD